MKPIDKLATCVLFVAIVIYYLVYVTDENVDQVGSLIDNLVQAFYEASGNIVDADVITIEEYNPQPKECETWTFSCYQ